MKKVCEECESWKERGDILYDEQCMLHNNIDSMQESMDEMGDRIRDLHDEIARLQNLLTKNKIDFQENIDEK